MEIYKIPARGIYTEDARVERLKFIENLLGTGSLTNIDNISIDPKKLRSNIENLIGSVEVPLGVAGPLLVDGDIRYLPMATTEGALLASVTRGSTAITNSGGATTFIVQQRMLRIPIFTFDSLVCARKFSDWVSDQLHVMRDVIKLFSNNAELLELNPVMFGRDIHCEFVYSTKDAAGQNMTTTCTWEASKKLIENYKNISEKSEHPIFWMVDGNLSSDKKVSYKSFIQGRGTKVIAECFLSDYECKKTLKVNSYDLYKGYTVMKRSAAACGMIGYNINIANVIAACFLATGQDVACVHESSTGLLSIELTSNGLYVSMMLPSLIVGTVGGGTGLPAQKEALKILGCTGKDSSNKLASTIASFCLALDLSTLAAIVSDQFAKAHERMGRNKPSVRLTYDNLNLEFFRDRLTKLNINKVTASSFEEGSSIITELTSSSVKKLIGLFPFDLTLSDTSIKVLVKIKPVDTEIALALNALAANCNPTLAKAFDKHKFELDTNNCHKRELLLSNVSGSISRVSPVVYGISINELSEEFIIFEELLGKNTILHNSVDNPELWTYEFIHAAIEDIASVHTNVNVNLIKEKALLQTLDKDYYTSKLDLWRALLIHAKEEFSWITNEAAHLIHKQIEDLDVWTTVQDNNIKTLVHNDFNPRNITFRSKPDIKLCVYDWELACIKNPLRDVAELLCFTVTDNQISSEFIKECVKVHLDSFGASDFDLWCTLFKAALSEFIVTRLMIYVMAHTFREYSFLERVFNNSISLLKESEKL